jgi:hypothetical protein
MIVKILAAALVIALTAGSVQADTFAYATTRTGQFGVVDLNTGVFAESGNMGLTPHRSRRGGRHTLWKRLR